MTLVVFRDHDRDGRTHCRLSGCSRRHRSARRHSAIEGGADISVDSNQMRPLFLSVRQCLHDREPHAFAVSFLSGGMLKDLKDLAAVVLRDADSRFLDANTAELATRLNVDDAGPLGIETSSGVSRSGREDLAERIAVGADDGSDRRERDPPTPNGCMQRRQEAGDERLGVDLLHEKYSTRPTRDSRKSPSTMFREMLTALRINRPIQQGLPRAMRDPAPELRRTPGVAQQIQHRLLGEHEFMLNPWRMTSGARRSWDTL